MNKHYFILERNWFIYQFDIDHKNKQMRLCFFAALYERLHWCRYIFSNGIAMKYARIRTHPHWESSNGLSCPLLSTSSKRTRSHKMPKIVFTNKILVFRLNNFQEIFPTAVNLISVNTDFDPCFCLMWHNYGIYQVESPTNLADIVNQCRLVKSKNINYWRINFNRLNQQRLLAKCLGKRRSIS